MLCLLRLQCLSSRLRLATANPLKRPPHIAAGGYPHLSTPHRTAAGQRRRAGAGVSQSASAVNASGGMTRGKAFVRDVAEEEKVFVFVTLGGKAQNLNRPKDEPLDKALGRLRAKAAPPVPKNRRRRGEAPPEASAQPAAEPLPVALFSDAEANSPIEASVPNGQAWPAGRCLQIGDEFFDIVYNPPTVDKISLVRRALVGHPLLALPEVMFADKRATTYRWLRSAPGGGCEWADAGCTDAVYTPSEADVGRSLRVECTAQRTGGSNGEAEVAGQPLSAETSAVEPAPPLPCSVLRAPVPMAAATAPAFRISSYNILADQYAGSTFAQQVLFGYCPAQFLDPEYRKQLVLKELLQYNSDVMCLQEVDQKAFKEYLLPHLTRAGFDGRYTNKMGKVKEGSATFWRTSRFVEAGRHDVLLRDVFKQPLDPTHGQWQAMLDASPELCLALQKVTTVAQATVLLPAPGTSGEPVCVVNTHLFYHPYAPHIRTMHTAAILEEAVALLGRLGCSPTPSMLFVGDLNSDLNDGIPGVVELLQSGRLGADFWDWDQGAPFRWGMNEEEGSEMQQASAPKPPGGKLATAADTAASPSGAMHSGYDTPSDEPRHSVAVVGADVTLPCGSLSSADDLKTPFSNYTSGYKALLDYVWYQPERLQVTAAVRQPTEEEIGSFIPSQRFPSDHLAVVYDLCPKS